MKAAHPDEGPGDLKRRARTRSTRFAVLAGAVVGLVAALVVIAFEDPGDPVGHVAGPLPRPADATWAAGTRPAPDFTLRNQDGRAVSLSSLRGSVVLLTFLDSRCQNICRLDGPLLGQVQRAQPAGGRPLIVVVSVNPEDTAASVRAAARKWGWQQDGWHWLMGDPKQLAEVWRAYGVGVKQSPADLLHSGVLYVIDRAGDERAGYATPFDAHRVAQVVRSIDEASS